MQPTLGRPADSLDSLALNLATQEQARQTALSDLRRLRKEAREQIHVLIAFLDASDEYVQTELEPDLGYYNPAAGYVIDGEMEDGDDEPSLGATSSINQKHWGQANGGNAVDCEQEHDGREPDDEGDDNPDDEPDADDESDGRPQTYLCRRTERALVVLAPVTLI